MFPVREVYRSLGTASVREASAPAHRLAATFAHLFGALRQLMKSDEKPPLAHLIELERLKAMMREQKDELDTRLYNTLFEKAKHGLELQRVARLEGRAEAALELAAIRTPASTPAAPPSLLFSTAADDYMREQQARGSWTPKTAEALKGAFDLFIEAVGDQPIVSASFSTP